MKQISLLQFLLGLLLAFMAGLTMAKDHYTQPFKVTFEKSSDSEFTLSKLHLQKDSTDTKIWFVNGIKCTPTIHYYTFTIDPKNY